MVAAALNHLTRDGWILFASRSVRLFSFGQLSVALVIYLSGIGLKDEEIGLLLTLTLVGDAFISLLLTAWADRLGRRRVLCAGALLKLCAGAVFASSRDFAVLTLAATLGVLSPSGNEVGPFLAIEQSAITQLLPDDQRTAILAWYNMSGSLCTALGALAAGSLVTGLTTGSLGRAPVPPSEAYQDVMIVYSCLAVVLAVLPLCASEAVEERDASRAASLSSSKNPIQAFFGIHKSWKIVLHLSVLFAMDAFAGALVLQSIISYWFQIVYGAAPASLGTMLFICNVVAGISSLLAAAVAARIGLIVTMVVTHLPSNVLLLLVPLVPGGMLPAMAVLCLRYCISQMDVPTRQSYVVAVVDPSEKTAAGGVTNIARSVGAALAPLLSGRLIANRATISYPFYLAGGLKIVYDLLILAGFKSVRPPEERVREQAAAAAGEKQPLLAGTPRG
eukprot:tig00021318_g20153.t1